MLSRAGALAAAVLVLPMLSACSPTGGATRTPTGFVVVTAGGIALVDGQADVPPTLDLRIAASPGLTPDTVLAKLDGTPLTLAGAGGAVTAKVSPMPLGSPHTLDVDVHDRTAQRIAFRVAPPAGAAAAVHTEPDGSAVLDLAFQLTPTDRAAVEQALPPGATPQWSDPTHLRATWPAAPGGTLKLPEALPTVRGSHLAAPLTLSLSAVPPGTLRRTVVPATSPAAGSAAKPVVVAFTVATAASRASLAAHADRVSVASPTGIRIGSGGALTGSPDDPAVATAEARGVPVWPLVQNDAGDPDTISRILADDTARARLVSTAARLDFPGLHLDVEGVPADQRDNLSRLVRDLADALHREHHKLAVAVVPHKPGHLNVFSAAYDLAAISQSADLVTLMTYDQHTAASDAGPVAGYDWDQQVLAGSLADLTDRSTALLGVPLYSRAWDGGEVVADSYASALQTALLGPGARVDYDFNARTPSVHYGSGATLWFDDAQSLAVKATLVGQLRMRGIAMWRLGFEDPAVWSLLPTNPPRP